VAEFRFGGEYHARPAGDVAAEQWAEHLYMRRNLDGPQEEWWFHRLGCRCWFLAQRDTRENRVLSTRWPEDVMSDE
jgi:heterotetrameric sarcosine oxidase delta subunit